MKRKILLIDDDGLVLKSVARLLGSRGYEVTVCKNGCDGVEAVKKSRFDLVISDVRMPRQDGLNTVRFIREVEKSKGWPTMPVVFVTGYASETAPIEAIDLGSQGYVLKPFDYDRFLSVVRNALGDFDDGGGIAPDTEGLRARMKALIRELVALNNKEDFPNTELRPLISKLVSNLETTVVALEQEVARIG